MGDYNTDEDVLLLLQEAGPKGAQGAESSCLGKKPGSTHTHAEGGVLRALVLLDGALLPPGRRQRGLLGDPSFFPVCTHLLKMEKSKFQPRQRMTWS